MTTVEVDDGTGFTAIDYASATVENAISDRKIAPTATVEVADRTAVSSGDDLRITEGGTAVFDGRVTKTKPRRRNPPEVTAKHRAYNLFEESVTLDVTGTDADVLTAALNDASSGGDFTLAYDGTPTTLGDAYAVEGRTVKRVFRDMVDRVDRIWWIGADSTIHVEERGARGTLQTIDTATDDAVVRDYTPDDTDTVVNDVTVVGTGGEQVTGTAQDSTSITTYGRKPKRVNVSYVRTMAEANDYANALLVPDPLESADLRVSNQALLNAPEPIVNYEIAVDDPALGVDSTLLVEGQTISEQVTDLALGEGAGVNAAKYNRQQKSTDDITEPGSVYGTERIADDAINSDKLGPESVTAAELADQAVEADKIFPGAVVEGALADEAVSTAKVQTSAITEARLADSAVSTTKIAQAAINGDKIQTGAIGASKLFVADWIPIGLSFTDDDPGTGDVSWNSHELVYNGTTYSISAGSTSATYIYWFEGDGFYQASNFKPTLGPDDALVCINDGGEANQILQATSIHGGSIVTNSIDASEIRAGAITANEIDTLDLDTDQLTIGDPGTTASIEFDVDGGVIRMIPDGSVAIGTQSLAYSFGAFQTMNIQTAVPTQGDNTGFLGSGSNAYGEINAYEFIDAGTGTAINDGGDPRAGVADGHGPPDHAAVTDEDGNEQGYSINRMARDAWDVIREQDRVIRDLEARVAELENAVDPNA